MPERWLHIGDLLIWPVFVVDHAVGNWKAEHRIGFLRSHGLEVLFVAVPFFRPLRVVRVGIAVLGDPGYSVADPSSGRCCLLQLLSRVHGHCSERGTRRGPGLLTMLGRALTTITTDGYGDIARVSTIGTLACDVPVLVAIGVLGVLTANVIA